MGQPPPPYQPPPPQPPGGPVPQPPGGPPPHQPAPPPSPHQVPPPFQQQIPPFQQQVPPPFQQQVPPPAPGWQGQPGYGDPPAPTPGAPRGSGVKTVAIVLAVVGALVVLCGGAGAVAYFAGVFDSDDPPPDDGSSWQERAAAIEGIINYQETRPDLLDPVHQEGSIDYEVLPPPGGPHNQYWQNCTGVVYDAPIASEHAVHSLEHGAVWVTYHPSLPADQVDRLAGLVNGVDYTLMSPFEGLPVPISVQAWGYQLHVDEAGDSRIEEFLRTLRNNAGPEAGRATCGGPNAITTTGTVPTVP